MDVCGLLDQKSERCLLCIPDLGHGMDELPTLVLIGDVPFQRGTFLPDESEVDISITVRAKFLQQKENWYSFKQVALAFQAL